MRDRFLPHDWFSEPIPANVVLGERSWLYSAFAFRHYQSRQPLGLKVGHDTGIYSGTFFDLGPEAEVSIGNYCTLVGVIICTNNRIVIQNYVFIAHEVVMADTFAAVPFSESPEAEIGKRTESVVTRTPVLIGENAWIGARAVLLDGAHIGEGAVIGAASTVNFKVPAYSIVAGNPARVVGRVRDKS